MPRTKSCLAAPKGKPKGQSKPTSISRSLVVCKVDGCDMKKRNDKIQAHQSSPGQKGCVNRQQFR